MKYKLKKDKSFSNFEEGIEYETTVNIDGEAYILDKYRNGIFVDHVRFNELFEEVRPKANMVDWANAVSKAYNTEANIEITKSCECGAKAADIPWHSDWCNQYTDYK
jgi:hypothetical protein